MHEKYQFILMISLNIYIYSKLLKADTTVYYIDILVELDAIYIGLNFVSAHNAAPRSR